MKKFLLLLIFAPQICHAQDAMPSDFVRLSDVTTSIVQDMRYATANNFMGKPIAGYKKGECILNYDTAVALKNCLLYTSRCV